VTQPLVERCVVASGQRVYGVPERAFVRCRVRAPRRERRVFEKFEIDRIEQCVRVGRIPGGEADRLGCDATSPRTQPGDARAMAGSGIIVERIVVGVDADLIGEERIAAFAFVDERLRGCGKGRRCVLRASALRGTGKGREQCARGDVCGASLDFPRHAIAQFLDEGVDGDCGAFFVVAALVRGDRLRFDFAAARDEDVGHFLRFPMPDLVAELLV